MSPVTVPFAIIVCALGLLGVCMAGMIVMVLRAEGRSKERRPDYDNL